MPKENRNPNAQRSAIAADSPFWIRFAAKLIDGLIVAVMMFVPIFIFALILGLSAARAAHGDFGATPGTTEFAASGSGSQPIPAQGVIGQAIGLLFDLIFLLVYTAYSTLFLGKFGATPGKMVLKLTVVDVSGGKIGYGRALARSGAEILSFIACLVGYIIAAFDDQKRALHDHMCNTRVIYNR